MKNKKIKIILIGLGSIGERHMRNLINLSLVSFLDKNESKTLKISKKYNLKYFSNIDEAVNSKPNAVIICTPTSNHISSAKKFVNLGIPILIEKPISNSLTETNNFLKFCKNKKSKIFVSCNMRYHIGPDTLKRKIHLIGKPLFLNSYFGNYLPNMRPNKNYKNNYFSKKKYGGGVVLDSIHELDYVQWFFGQCKLIKSFTKKISNLKINVEDFASIHLEHKNKVISNIQLNYIQNQKERGCKIVGDKGILNWHSDGKYPEKVRINYFDKKNNKWKSLLRTDNYDINLPYLKMIKEFLVIVANKKKTNCRLQDSVNAFKSLKICKRILEK